MKTKNENIVNEEEIQKTVLDVLDESDKSDEVVEPLIKLAPAVPGAPNNMIHKHIDNFLAKIAGETPVDGEVRDSTEYWLDKIGQYAGGGSTDTASTKKIYCHPIIIVCRDDNLQGRFGIFIFDNDPTPYTTARFIAWKNAMYEQIGGTVRILTTGAFIKNGVIAPACFIAKTPSYDMLIYGTASTVNISTIEDNAITLTDAQFISSIVAFEDGVNAIN